MTVTGTSSSRLAELKKYAVNVPFNQQYVGGGSLLVDGVDFSNSIAGNIVTYYLGGIKYMDRLTGSTSGTTFEMTPTSFFNDIWSYTAVTTINTLGTPYTAITTTNNHNHSSTTRYSGNTVLFNLMTGTTIYHDTKVTTTNNNFLDLPYYKNPNKEGIISNPKITDDVFIVRQELSAFDSNYRLEYIKNLNDLLTYAGGGFFNIVKNN